MVCVRLLFQGGLAIALCCAQECANVGTVSNTAYFAEVMSNLVRVKHSGMSGYKPLLFERCNSLTSETMVPYIHPRVTESICTVNPKELHCVPSPCRVLEVNYFWNYTSDKFIDNVQLVDDTLIFRGTGDCGPMVGYELVSRDGHQFPQSVLPSLDYMVGSTAVTMLSKGRGIFGGGSLTDRSSAIPFPMKLSLDNPNPAYRYREPFNYQESAPFDGGILFSCYTATMPPPLFVNGTVPQATGMHWNKSLYDSPWDNKDVWNVSHCDIFSSCLWLEGRCNDPRALQEKLHIGDACANYFEHKHDDWVPCLGLLINQSTPVAGVNFDTCCRLAGEMDYFNFNTTYKQLTLPYRLGPSDIDPSVLFPQSVMKRSAFDSTQPCDCKNFDYNWRCEAPLSVVLATEMYESARVAQNAFNVSSGTGFVSSVYLKCSYSWVGIAAEDYPTIGLYIPPARESIEILDRDVFAGDLTPASLFEVEGEVPSQENLKRMVLNPGTLQSFERRYKFPGTCLRYPYGQVGNFSAYSGNPFYPPGVTQFWDESLIGYCEHMEVEGGHTPLVHCANDRLSFADRVSLCEDMMANNIFYAFAVYERTFESACNTATKVCLVIPGNGKYESVGAILQHGTDLTNYTVLVAPFTTDIIYHYKAYRSVAPIGQTMDDVRANGLHNQSTHVPTLLPDTTEVFGWVVETDIYEMLDHTVGDAANVQSVVTRFYAYLQGLPRCPGGGYKFPPLEGGKGTYSCQAELLTPSKETGIVVPYKGMHFDTAVQGVPVTFTGRHKSASTCTRYFLQEATTIRNHVFDQGACDMEVFDTVPVKHVGSQAGPSLLQFACVDCYVAAAVLGDDTEETSARGPVDVSGLAVNITDTGEYNYTLLTAMAYGNITVACARPVCRIFVQSVLDLHFIGANLSILNVSEYSTLFGSYVEQTIFSPKVRLSNARKVAMYVVGALAIILLMLQVALFRNEHNVWKQIVHKTYMFHEVRTEEWDIYKRDGEYYVKIHEKDISQKAVDEPIWKYLRTRPVMPATLQLELRNMQAKR